MSDPLRLSRAALDQDDDADNALSPLCRAILSGTHRDVRPKRDDHADAIAALITRVAKLEAAAKRKPSRKAPSKADMTLMAEAIGNVLGEAIEPLHKRIEKLEAQSSGVKWAGVWHQDMRCAEGELITDRGSLWLCTSATNDRPGDNASAFKLIVKNGHADGRRHATTGVRQ